MLKLNELKQEAEELGLEHLLFCARHLEEVNVHTLYCTKFSKLQIAKFFLN